MRFTSIGVITFSLDVLSVGYLDFVDNVEVQNAPGIMTLLNMTDILCRNPHMSFFPT
jgi:hypothetical protein